MPTHDPLDSADRWGKVGLGAGVLGFFGLLIAVAVHWFNAQEALLPGPIYFTLVAALIVLTMGSWNGLRAHRIERATKAQVADLKLQIAGLQNFVVLAEHERTRRAPIVAHRIYAGRAAARDAMTDQTPVVLAEPIEAVQPEVPPQNGKVTDIGDRIAKKITGV